MAGASAIETLHITVTYFSGRPDPTWNLPSTNEQYNNVINLLNEAASANLLGHRDQMPSRLGYKGFLVRRNRTTHWIFGSRTVELQKVLLSTAPEDRVPNQLKERLSEAIDIYSASTD